MKLSDLLTVNTISFHFSKCSRCGNTPYEEELEIPGDSIGPAKISVADYLYKEGWRINASLYITCPDCNRAEPKA